jgi:chromosome segregation ATPase
MRIFPFLIALLSAVFILPFYAFSEYKIVLKNGSSIIVDSYKKIDGRIQFYKSGGLIEIENSEVLEIHKTEERSDMRAVEQQAAGGQVTTGAPANSSASPELSDAELRNKIEEIQKEKETLKQEASALTEEVEKLNTEIRKEGRVLAIRKKRDLEKKKEDLERRMTELNRRIEELNKEEEDLLRRLWKY